MILVGRVSLDKMFLQRTFGWFMEASGGYQQHRKKMIEGMMMWVRTIILWVKLA